MTSDNNKKIAKNTVALYIRMIILMIVSLYTARVVLNTLGVKDFGIYNVVGGIVTMLGFINGAMSLGTQRFLNFELGKNDFVQLRKVFSMSINIHIIIVFIVFVLAETVGLWFLNSKMNFPIDRMYAVNWVYQLSILSTIVKFLQVPYNSLIIAHEKLTVFAYVSIVEAILRLAIVFALSFFPEDKLIVYSILTLIVFVIIQLFYYLYCKIKFAESSYQFTSDVELFKKLINFSGWNLMETLSSVLSNQGLNVLLNIFFGPIINAARAIAMSVDGALSNFSTNFLTAVAPQITKRYASGDESAFLQLIFQSTKLAFFLKLIFVVPIVIEIDAILSLWLVEPPLYASTFCILVITDSLIKTLSAPLVYGAYATGSIKKFQLNIGMLMILKLPIAYLVLILYTQPVFVFYVTIFIDFIALFVRVYLLNNLVKFDVRLFVLNVLLKCAFVLVLVLITMYLFTMVIEPTLLRLFLTFFISSVLSTVLIYFYGLDDHEQDFVKAGIFHIKSRFI